MASKLSTMKQKIYSTHPYYSTPKLSPEEQDRRLEEFLAKAAAETTPSEGDGDLRVSGADSGFVL